MQHGTIFLYCLLEVWCDDLCFHWMKRSICRNCFAYAIITECLLGHSVETTTMAGLLGHFVEATMSMSYIECINVVLLHNFGPWFYTEKHKMKFNSGFSKSGENKAS